MSRKRSAITPKVEEKAAVGEGAGDAMDALGRELASPVVPGELAVWARNARKSMERLSPLLARELSEARPEQLQQIADADPALLHRVNELQEEDAKLEKGFAKLHEALEKLAVSDLLHENVGGEGAKMAERLREAGLDLIKRYRKQCVALNAWMQEAANRERGVAD